MQEIAEGLVLVRDLSAARQRLHNAFLEPDSAHFASNRLLKTRQFAGYSCRGPLVFNLVEFRFQAYWILFRRGAVNGDRLAAGEIFALDLPRTPGKSTPDLLVVIDLHRHRFAVLLRINLKNLFNRSPTRRTARPTPP